MEHGTDRLDDDKSSTARQPDRSLRRLIAFVLRLVSGFVLVLIALYFGDQALEVTRLPFSTLALRDLLNALLMAMMGLIFASWAVIAVIPRRKRAAKEKGGTP
ncbi:MAG: hypothetical protein ABL964_00200 [Steroidobacteraceae bacterium]